MIGRRRPSAILHDLLLAIAGAGPGYLQVSGKSLHGIDPTQRWVIEASYIAQHGAPIWLFEALAVARLALHIGAGVRRDRGSGSSLARLHVLPIVWTAPATYDRRSRPVIPDATDAIARLSSCGLTPSMVIIGGAPVAEQTTITALLPLEAPTIEDVGAASSRLQRLSAHLGATVITTLADVVVPIPGSLVRVGIGELRAHVVADDPTARVTLAQVDAVLAPPAAPAPSARRRSAPQEVAHVAR